jgi:hypothetical protein
VDLSVQSGWVDHERDVRLVAGGEEGVMDAPGGAGLAPGRPDADLLQGHGRSRRMRAHIVEAYGEDNGKLYLDTPNNHERRSVPIPKFLDEGAQVIR